MAKKKKPRKARQQVIPGTEPPFFGDIESAANAYVDARDQRMDLTKEEVRTGTELAAAMRQHGLTLYQTAEGRTVTLVSKEKVKVSRADNGELDVEE